MVPVISPVSDALNWTRTFPVTTDISTWSSAAAAIFARFDGGGRRVVIVSFVDRDGKGRKFSALAAMICRRDTTR